MALLLLSYQHRGAFYPSLPGADQSKRQSRVPPGARIKVGKQGHVSKAILRNDMICSCDNGLNCPPQKSLPVDFN